MIFIVLILPASVPFLRQLGEFQPITHIGRGAIQNVIWRPDGYHLLVNSSSGAWIYNTALQDIAHLPNAANARYSPDGQWVAASDADRRLMLWDAITFSLSSFPAEVYRASFSPNGQWIAAINAQGQVALFDAQTLEAVRAWNTSVGENDYLSWSPTSDRFALISLLGATLWDVTETSRQPQRLTFGRFNNILWSPDGTVLAVNTVEDTLTIWEINTGHRLASIASGIPQDLPSYFSIEELTFTPYFLWKPDSSHIMRYYVFNGARGLDQQFGFDVYDPRTGGLIASGSIGLPPSFSPDGNYLAHPFGLYETNSYQQIHLLNSLSTMLAWSADSQRFALNQWDYGTDHNTLAIFDLVTNTITHQLVNPIDSVGIIYILSWSPDSNFLSSVDTDGLLTVWNTQTGQMVGSRHEHNRNFRLAAYNSDNNLLATTDDTLNGVRIWDTRNGGARAVLTGHQGNILRMEWQPGGTLIATSTGSASPGSVDGGDVRIYDGATGRLVTVLQHSGPVTGIGWSSDGTTLVTAAHFGEVSAWDVFTGVSYLLYDRLDLTTPRVYWNPRQYSVAIQWVSGSHGSTGLMIFDVQNGAMLSPLLFTELYSIFDQLWTAEGKRIIGVHGHCLSDNRLCGHYLAFTTYFPNAVSPETTNFFTYDFEHDFYLPFYFSSRPFVFWSPDSHSVLTLNGGVARGWSIASDYSTSGDLLFTYPYVERIVWRSDSQQIALIRDIEPTVIVNTLSGNVLYTLENVETLEWSPDSNYLITHHRDEVNEFYLRDASSGEIIANLNFIHVEWNSTSTQFAEFSPGMITLWAR